MQILDLTLSASTFGARIIKHLTTLKESESAVIYSSAKNTLKGNKMGHFFPFFSNLFPNSVFTRVLKGFFRSFLDTHTEAKQIKEENIP